jgi:hypothetical protein
MEHYGPVPFSSGGTGNVGREPRRKTKTLDTTQWVPRHRKKRKSDETADQDLRDTLQALSDYEEQSITVLTDMNQEIDSVIMNGQHHQVPGLLHKLRGQLESIIKDIMNNYSGDTAPMLQGKLNTHKEMQLQVAKTTSESKIAKATLPPYREPSDQLMQEWQGPIEDAYAAEEASSKVVPLVKKMMTHTDFAENWPEVITNPAKAEEQKLKMDAETEKLTNLLQEILEKQKQIQTEHTKRIMETEEQIRRREAEEERKRADQERYIEKLQRTLEYQTTNLEDSYTERMKALEENYEYRERLAQESVKLMTEQWKSENQALWEKQQKRKEEDLQKERDQIQTQKQNLEKEWTQRKQQLENEFAQQKQDAQIELVRDQHQLQTIRVQTEAELKKYERATESLENEKRIYKKRYEELEEQKGLLQEVMVKHRNVLDRLDSDQIAAALTVQKFMEATHTSLAVNKEWMEREETRRRITPETQTEMQKFFSGTLSELKATDTIPVYPPTFEGIKDREDYYIKSTIINQLAMRKLSTQLSSTQTGYTRMMEHTTATHKTEIDTIKAQTASIIQKHEEQTSQLAAVLSMIQTKLASMTDIETLKKEHIAELHLFRTTVESLKESIPDVAMSVDTTVGDNIAGVINLAMAREFSTMTNTLTSSKTKHMSETVELVADIKRLFHTELATLNEASKEQLAKNTDALRQVAVSLQGLEQYKQDLNRYIGQLAPIPGALQVGIAAIVEKNTAVLELLDKRHGTHLAEFISAAQDERTNMNQSISHIISEATALQTQYKSSLEANQTLYKENIGDVSAQTIANLTQQQQIQNDLVGVLQQFKQTVSDAGDERKRWKGWIEGVLEEQAKTNKEIKEISAKHMQVYDAYRNYVSAQTTLNTKEKQVLQDLLLKMEDTRVVMGQQITSIPGMIQAGLPPPPPPPPQYPSYGGNIATSSRSNVRQKDTIIQQAPTHAPQDDRHILQQEEQEEGHEEQDMEEDDPIQEVRQPQPEPTQHQQAQQAGAAPPIPPPPPIPMTKNTTDSISEIQRHRLNLPKFRTELFGDIREAVVDEGLYRPANRARKAFGIYNRALDLAQKTPFIAKYNFVRA